MLDAPNVNALWSGVLVETFFRLGLRQAVVSPGSRSAPLAFALAGHSGLEAIPVLDERSAGFFALGLAKRERCPVLLLCTSGTAGANYFPAVIEAREGAAPLIVVTADRPPEMRDCAAGQAIDQRKLFGSYANFHHELALPEAAEASLRYLRQTAVQAWTRALRPEPGPVHLNAPFRDPLPPIEDGAARAFAAGVDWERFFAGLGPLGAAEPAAAAPELPAGARGLIVAGPASPAEPAAYAAAVGRIARALGWPVLADALSPCRHHAAASPGPVTTYDAILRNPAAAEKLRPEFVLGLDDWPTSKVLRAWLERADAPMVLVSSRIGDRDGLHGRTRQIPVSAPALAGVLAPLPPHPRTAAYGEDWREQERRVRAEIDRRLEAEESLFEPKAAWLLGRHLPPGTPVFVASSMPVRDAECVWPANDRRCPVFFNRGANGIDGTLSTALGMAHGGPPAVLLTGDLALLHDAGGLLLRGKFRGSLTVVLINNRGGGIFGHLPVARFDPPFEEFFATPQEADFGRLCAAFGAGHAEVRDWGRFAEAISALPPAGIRVLEIRTDRRADAARRQETFAAASAGEIRK